MREAIMAETNQCDVQEYGAATEITFGLGRGSHYALQNYVLRDILLGQWKCVSCGELTAPMMKYSDLTVPVFRMPGCDGCGNTTPNDDDMLFEYVEPEAIDQELGLIGHIDGIYLNEDGEKCIPDFKNLGNWSYKQFRYNIYPDYKIQMAAYYILFGIKNIGLLCISRDKPKECYELPMEPDEQMIRLVKEICVLSHMGVIDGVDAIKDNPKAYRCQEHCIFKEQCPNPNTKL
jgi:hypothetical protein